MQLASEGSCAAAIPLLNEVISSDASDATAQVALGTCYMQAAEYNSALSAFQSATKLSPDVSNLVDLSQAQSAEGLETQALTTLERAARAATNVSELVTVGRALDNASDPSAALNTLNKVPAPLRDYTWYDAAGLAETSLPQYSAAIADFTTSFQLAPPNEKGTILVNFGDAYWSSGNYSAALTEYSAAVMANPPSPIYVYDQIGLCDENLGRYPEASAAFDQALASHPNGDQLGTIDTHLIQLDLSEKDPTAALIVDQQLQKDASVPASSKSQATQLLQSAGVSPPS